MWFFFDKAQLTHGGFYSFLSNPLGILKITASINEILANPQIINVYLMDIFGIFYSVSKKRQIINISETIKLRDLKFGGSLNETRRS